MNEDDRYTFEYCPECGSDCYPDGDVDRCSNEDCGAVYQLQRSTPAPTEVLQ